MGKFYFNKSNDWNNLISLNSLSTICWNCGNLIASVNGYKKTHYEVNDKSNIYICPHCNAPIIFDKDNKLVLNPLPGKEIKKLPENISYIYSEIRTCMQTNSFTSVVMLSRKLIMNIAVHEEAEKNKSFKFYVDYLYEKHITPKKSKSKADAIRELGNSANHEIEIRTEEEAKHCFEFIELLLKVNYEFADNENEN